VKPVVSFAATLILLGATFLLLHLVGVWAGVIDVVALLLFAIPITGFIAYCTHQSQTQMLRSALQIYGSFCAVVVSAVGLVYLIG